MQNENRQHFRQEVRVSSSYAGRDDLPNAILGADGND